MKKSLLNSQMALLGQTEDNLPLIKGGNIPTDLNANIQATKEDANLSLTSHTISGPLNIEGSFTSNIGLGQNFAINVYDEVLEDTARFYYSTNDNAYRIDGELRVQGTSYAGYVACNGTVESLALQSNALRLISRPTTPGVRYSIWDVIPTEDQSLSFVNSIAGQGGGQRAQLTQDGRFKASTAPLAPEDLTNKAYVDSKIGSYVDFSSAQTISGDKNFTGTTSFRQSLYSGDEALDAWYVSPNQNNTEFYIADGNGEGLYIVPNGTSTLKSSLSVNGNVEVDKSPSLPNHLTNKEYVDAKVTGLVDLSSPQTITGIKTLSGKTIIEGYLEFPSEFPAHSFIVGGSSMSLDLVDQNGNGLSLQPNEAMFSGVNLSVDGRVTSMPAPTDAGHLTNKAYVDSKITSGTYTPEMTTGVPNLTVTVGRHHYTRVGNQVTVYGVVSLLFQDFTEQIFFFTLPIASNLTDDVDLIGVGSVEKGGGARFSLFPAPSGDKVQVIFESAATNQTCFATYSFMYTIK